MPEIDTKPMTDRVVVNVHGLSFRANTAFEVHGVCAKIIFIRDDGWSLGAPSEFEHVAYRLWMNQWREFRRFPDYEPHPMSEYKPSKRRR